VLQTQAEATATGGYPLMANIRVCAKVLFITSLWGQAAGRPVFAQPPAGNPTTQPATADPSDTQRPASRNPSGSIDPASVPAGKPAGTPNQPLAVNPVTGLSSISASDYHPLTGKQRWKLYWKQNYWSVGAYFGPAFTALALDQATGSPSQWGGGFAGYGQRLGSRILTAIAQGTFQAALAPALDEDVRYISRGQGGFKRRALHAVAFSFVTFNSQGRTTLNISNLVSYYAATALSTTWVPISGSKGTYILTNGSEQIALSVPVNLVQEFWPEIRHKILRRP
jgi:hypothetical protein